MNLGSNWPKGDELEKNVTAEVVLLKLEPEKIEIGVTLSGEPKLLSGQFRFLFDSYLSAFAHLLLDFEIQVSSDEMDNLFNDGKIVVPVDFEKSRELFEEIHYQLNIHEEADFFGSYKEPIAEYSLIDVTDRDFEGRFAPKDNVNEIANAVKESGRDSAFYFLAYSDTPNTKIFDVHFLTKDEIYLRKAGRWKVINPVEWDRQEESMEWLINPELGVEFLRIYDQGGMTVGEGEKFSLPDGYFSDPLGEPEWQSSSSPQNPNSNLNSNLNSNSSSRDYFHCVVYGDEIHVHRINDLFQPVSSDEFSEFNRDGGYFMVSQEEWVMIIPSARRGSTDDYASVFETLMEDLPARKSPNMTCSEWIEYVNNAGHDRFEIEGTPSDIGEGEIWEFANRWVKEKLKSTGWEFYSGDR